MTSTGHEGIHPTHCHLCGEPAFKDERMHGGHLLTGDGAIHWCGTKGAKAQSLPAFDTRECYCGVVVHIEADGARWDFGGKSVAHNHALQLPMPIEAPERPVAPRRPVRRAAGREPPSSPADARPGRPSSRRKARRIE